MIPWYLSRPVLVLAPLVWVLGLSIVWIGQLGWSHLHTSRSQSHVYGRLRATMDDGLNHGDTEETDSDYEVAPVEGQPLYRQLQTDQAVNQVAVPTVRESACGLLQVAVMLALCVFPGLDKWTAGGFTPVWSSLQWGGWYLMSGAALVNVFLRRSQLLDSRSPPAHLHISLGLILGGYLILLLNLSLFDALDFTALEPSRFQTSLWLLGLVALHWLAHTSSYLDYPNMPRIRSASLFEWASMRWVWPTLSHAITADRLELSDCQEVPDVEEPERLYAAFMHSWRQHKSLLRGLLAVFSWHLLLVLLLSALLLLAWFLPAFAMNNFLQHLERREAQFAAAPSTVEPLSIGYAWCLLLFLGALLRTCAEVHCWWFTKNFSYRTVNVLHMVIARALLDSAKPPSNAVSLAAGDARKLGEAFNRGSASLVLPFRAVVAILYLARLLGWVPVVGVVLVVCSVMPINMWIAAKMKDLQRESSQATDARLGLSEQVIQAIRLIKTQVWEDHFSSTIQETRAKELKLLARAMVWQALMMLLATFTPLFVTIVAFATYAFLNTSDGSGTLPPSTAFTVIQACYMLDYPMRVLPELYAKVVLVGMISWSRVQEFLTVAYAHPAATGTTLSADAMVSLHRQTSFPGQVALEGVKVHVSDKFELHVAGRIDVPKGKLTLVVGPIASGKTTLLLTLLGELSPSEGIVHFPPPSTASYVEQTPFLLNTTLRDNVTFGLPYDPARFTEVMRRCALAQDLAALPNCDLTLLGDRGVTLSGGTRQRVALARALYPRHATTVIADDVLSAVDAVTAAHLYKHALVPAAKVEGKTVILVSHAVGLAATDADMVIVMDSGKVVASGTPKDVLVNRSEWSVSSDPSTDQVQVADQSPVIVDETKSAGERHEEERSHGAVKWAHYRTYVHAFGVGLACLIVIGLIAVQSLQLLADMYLKNWSSEAPQGTVSNPLYTLGFVAALKFGSSILYGLVLLLCALGSYAASRKLHEDMIAHVLAFPLQWFTSNPSSRVINRLAKDLGLIDSALVIDIKDFIVWLLVNGFAVVAIALASPMTLAFCTPLLAVYGWVGYVYVRASRDLRRMTNVAYSPVVQQLNELQAGGPCMRAFGQGAHFLRSMLQCLRDYLRPNIWNTGANRWFAIVGDSLIAFLSFTVFLAFLVLVAVNTNPTLDSGERGLQQERISPWAALALNYLLMMIEGVRIVVAYYAFVEVEMSSVERVGEYLGLPTESRAGQSNVFCEPTAGPLVVRNVSVAYSQTSDSCGDWNWVLRNVSMSVPAGSRMAIVGRTGSGKTSLFGALQRLVPHVQGDILLDGVITSQLDLRYLRSQLGCVNQDNFLFSGTLRSNLDPTGVVQDAEMHELLREFSSQLPFGLDHELTSSTAVSKGQAQLIGLLRSLLAAKVKNARLFLCDEPTSAIDHETDAQFWNVFRRFQAWTQRGGSPATVLMIAHRIRTLADMDCDLVAVMDAGRIVELGHPRELLQQSGGRFVQLTRESGTEVEALLRQYYA